MNWLKDTPWWVLAICLALASIEPITHFGLQRINNEHAVHSGLHTPDSAIYLTCMKMLDNDFFSPYATCKAPNGPNDPAFLPTPFHWLYAILGEIGRWFGIGEFMFLGLANGFFGFIYLLVVYRFLKTAVPDLANLAFLLWSLGGGLGGVFWFGTLATGAQSAPNFEEWSFRLIMYELIEGPGLFPVTHQPRLYYTASLALCFGSLIALIDSLRIRCKKQFAFAGLLLFGAALINIRLGAFTWIIALMYLLSIHGISLQRIAKLSVLTFLPVLAAGLVFIAMQWARPIFTETALAIVRESIWPTGFLSAAVLFILPVCAAVWINVPTLPILPRIAAGAAIGYLVVIFPLVFAYQIYHGTLWQAGDHTALARVSDFAVIGAVLGAILGWLRYPHDPGDPFVSGESESLSVDVREPGAEWFVLWALVFAGAGMSAFGQGWGVGFAPQRFMAMLGLPLAVSAAVGLRFLDSRAPWIAVACTSLIVACGLAAIFAGSLYFQAPLGRTPQSDLYSTRHPEIVTPEDHRLISALDPGIVLTVPELADAIAVRDGMRGIGGIVSGDLSDASSLQLDTVYDTLCRVQLEQRLSPDVTLESWCVDYVIRPHNSKLRSGLREVALDGDPRLTVERSEGSGAILRVREP